MGASSSSETDAPSSEGAAGTAVERTVKNLKGREEGARMVAMALPAYIGREKVVLFEEESCETEMMSETAGRSSFAARRGRRDLAAEEWEETT